MKSYGIVSAMSLAGLMVLSVPAARAGDCEKCGDAKDVKKGAFCAFGKKGDAPGCPVVGSREAVVNTAALKALIEAKAPAAVLDARSGKYDDGKRLPGARQLSPDAEESVITTALPDKNALIVTYCAGLTCPASKSLADRLKKLGYSKVIEYPEGIAGWIAAGNAVEQQGK